MRAPGPLSCMVGLLSQRAVQTVYIAGQQTHCTFAFWAFVDMPALSELLLAGWRGYIEARGQRTAGYPGMGSDRFLNFGKPQRGLFIAEQHAGRDSRKGHVTELNLTLFQYFFCQFLRHHPDLFSKLQGDWWQLIQLCSSISIELFRVLAVGKVGENHLFCTFTIFLNHGMPVLRYL